MAESKAKTAKPSAESAPIETYIVVASMVGKFAQSAQVNGDELKSAGYNVDSLLKKGVIEIFDPAKAEKEAAAQADALATPRERAMQEQINLLQEQVGVLTERLDTLESAFPKEEQTQA
ncbi:hypothetical protein EON80_08660 [bacterium]|nr:MAG: hypothetical protein EON80_08660 [bacterium]